MRQVLAFVGNYGSGKTELSLNTAYRLRTQGKKVILVDLDIVNPYFRSSEHRGQLEHAGIELVAPVYAGTNVDAPMISPLVGGSFARTECDLILDVGGDPVGAKALGGYRHKFREQKGKLYFVINIYRPLTGTVENILTMLENVQSSCGIRADGLINNSNLSYETTPEQVLQGLELVREVRDETGIPIVYSSASEGNLLGVPGETFEIQRQLGLRL